MNKKIFRSSLIVSLLAVFACIVFVIGILFQYFENQLKKELKNEATYVAVAIKTQGIEYLNNFGEQNEKRITLIDPNGTVIADTIVDEENMENHSDREEVQMAIKYGTGTSIRYSKTLTEKDIYYAEKLEDGNILRVSTRQYTVFAIIFDILQPIIAVVTLTFIMTLVASIRVSKSIVKPINHLDLEHPENNDAYEELSPLLSKIASQKKTIESQLRAAKKQQEEFKLITENMSEGLVVIDNNLQILTYNTAALKLLDINDQVDGNVLSMNRTKSFREVIEKALSGTRAESDLNVNDRAYSVIASPVFEDGNIIGAIIVILDISEIVSREQMRREFTSNVSHELKTPLTSISGFAEMMMNGNMSKAEVMDFSKSIYDEAQRLISLVLDILKISELDEKSSDYVFEDVDLLSLSEDIGKRLEPEASKRNIKIYVDGTSVKINGVKKVLDEIIYNLCDNAIKYNVENGKVDIMIESTEKTAKVTVKDTGIGIPKMYQDRIFERFYRIDKARSKAIGGTGLGLSIVKHGAKIHNANIDLQSDVNVGTTVKIEFPIE